ncbi:MAG: hypothetical protein WKF85_04165 [Chitinophagaceae bacterium]
MKSLNNKVTKESTVAEVKKYCDTRKYNDHTGVMPSVYNLLWDMGDNSWESAPFDIKINALSLIELLSKPEVANQLGNEHLREGIVKMLTGLVDFSIDLADNGMDELKLYYTDMYLGDNHESEKELANITKEYHIKNQVRELEMQLES